MQWDGEVCLESPVLWGLQFLPVVRGPTLARPIRHCEAQGEDFCEEPRVASTEQVPGAAGASLAC